MPGGGRVVPAVGDGGEDGDRLEHVRRASGSCTTRGWGSPSCPKLRSRMRFSKSAQETPWIIAPMTWLSAVSALTGMPQSLTETILMTLDVAGLDVDLDLGELRARDVLAVGLELLLALRRRRDHLAGHLRRGLLEGRRLRRLSRRRRSCRRPRPAPRASRPAAGAATAKSFCARRCAARRTAGRRRVRGVAAARRRARRASACRRRACVMSLRLQAQLLGGDHRPWRCGSRCRCPGRREKTSTPPSRWISHLAPTAAVAGDHVPVAVRHADARACAGPWPSPGLLVAALPADGLGADVVLDLPHRGSTRSSAAARAGPCRACRPARRSPTRGRRRPADGPGRAAAPRARRW